MCSCSKPMPRLCWHSGVGRWAAAFALLAEVLSVLVSVVIGIPAVGWWALSVLKWAQLMGDLICTLECPPSYFWLASESENQDLWSSKQIFPNKAWDFSLVLRRMRTDTQENVLVMLLALEEDDLIQTVEQHSFWPRWTHRFLENIWKHVNSLSSKAGKPFFMWEMPRYSPEQSG